PEWAAGLGRGTGPSGNTQGGGRSSGARPDQAGSGGRVAQGVPGQDGSGAGPATPARRKGPGGSRRGTGARVVPAADRSRGREEVGGDPFHAAGDRRADRRGGHLPGRTRATERRERGE